ncbi:MAG: hypothetical protein RLY58_2414, partial [Pseudomonadota bacterium]|jgi:aminopeptidase N
MALWTVDGMQFYADLAQVLDAKNPILGSRILQALSRWYTLSAPMQQQARDILLALQAQVSSSSVTETLGHLLRAG